MSEQQTITIQALSERMPIPFRPLDGLVARLDGPAFELEWFRVSAFPKFATTREELVEWIDHAPHDTLEAHRDRFRALLMSIAEEHPTFAHRRRYAKSQDAVKIDPRRIDPGLVTEWTEEDAADIFVPAASVAFVGHDDFGCNCFFDRAAENWILAKVKASGLFCVRPPGENAPGESK